MTEPRARPMTAALWSGAEALFKTPLQLAVSIFMARTLSPAEFGLLALALVLSGIAIAIADGGFSQALIQGDTPTEEEKSSVFTVNLLVSLVLAGGIVAGAGAYARYFGQPMLESLSWAMAANVVITSLGATQTALLARNLDFRLLARIGALAAAVSGLAAVVAALLGFGVWSLVVNVLTSSVLTSGMLWRLAGWRPRARPRIGALRRLFGFGSYLLLSSLLTAAYVRLSAALIGKLYGIHEVGHYGRAEHSQQMATQIMANAANRVALPVFAAAKDDPQQQRGSMVRGCNVLQLVNVPLMLCMAFLAEPLIVTLFGMPWKPAAAYLQILCLAGLLWPLQVVNTSLIKAQGRSDVFFWMELVKRSVALVAIVVAAQFGIVVLAWAQVGIALFTLGINGSAGGRAVGYGVLRQLADMWPYLLMSAAMLGAMWLAQSQMPPIPWLRLALLSGLGAAVYLGLCLIARPRHFGWLLGEIQSRLPQRFRRA
ncbi:MAG: lipopolysaccharide biosynthesis protein [Aquabacterium sp.]